MARANHVGMGARGGFTLVELLVVITIIGILMGLLIPAVNAARETARRNQCSTQLNNLSKAAMQYEMAKKQFPGFLNDFGFYNAATSSSNPDPSDPDAGSKTFANHKKIGSWVVSLLPSLDAQPTYEIWTQDKYPLIASGEFTSNAAPSIAIMQCPSSTTLDGERGRNSYISNNGMHDLDASGASVERSPNNSPDGSGSAASPFPTVSWLDSMSKDNGVFNQKYKYSVTSPARPVVGPVVRLDDFKDGQGNTVLFSENLQAVPWHQVHFAESTAVTALGTGTATGEVAYPGFARMVQGFVWHYEDPSEFNGAPQVSLTDARLINSLHNAEDIFVTRMTAANAASVARPSSAHNDGVNMAFADGSSRFVQDSIDYRVYQAIMTPRGKSSLVPFREFILPGESL